MSATTSTPFLRRVIPVSGIIQGRIVPGAQIMGINVDQGILMGLTASLAPGREFIVIILIRKPE